MDSKPPNKPGPQTAIGDTLLKTGKLFIMRIPYDISEQEITDPATWTTSLGRSSPSHPCALISQRKMAESMIEHLFSFFGPLGDEGLARLPKDPLQNRFHNSL